MGDKEQKTETSETNENEGLDFDLAFDEAAIDPASKPAEPETAETPSTDDEPPVETPSDEGEGEGEGEGEEETPAAETPEPPKAPEKPVEQPPQPTADEEARKRIAQLEKELADAKQPPKEEKKEEPPPELLDEAEKNAVAELEKEWPEVTAGLNARMKEMQANMASMVKTEIQNLVKQLQPALQTVNTVANNSFRDGLLQAHSDLDEVFPKVEAWADAQPGRIKASYNDILDNGNVEEVAELITMFKQSPKHVGKKEAGAVTPPATTPPASTTPPAAVGKKTSADDADKQQRLDQLSTVKRERTGVSAEPDVNDFDIAFEKAAQS